MVWGTDMNDLEKQSFYSFLGLYLISSLLFVLFVGYWYYTAQKNALESEVHYKLEHIVDLISGDIVMAHMQKREVNQIQIPDHIKLALIDVNNQVVDGELLKPSMEIKPGNFELDGYYIMISDAPQEHLNIRYVVAQSNILSRQMSELKNWVLQAVLFVFIFIVLIAWRLSKLFMKPVQERVLQIERFINDITHELNTPITSLTMATDQAIKQGKCTPKTLNNVSISTKQLYDIYRSLTYLNFSSKEEISEVIDLKEILDKSIDYYRPLADIKRIEFKVESEERIFTMPKIHATLLFGNLIGNAIKYSSPKSTITITLKDGVFCIKDEGIGIELKKQKEIFKKFKRGTEYSGGFGVGLSIVKNICDEYGIKIELNSALGKGTEFRLYM